VAVDIEDFHAWDFANKRLDQFVDDHVADSYFFFADQNWKLLM